MATELSGFTVGVTADRRRAEQVLMLERLGIEALPAPTIHTLPVGGDGGLRDVTEGLIAEPPDVLVATTGLGVRSWFGLAAAWGRDEALVTALAAGTRVVARGPKAASAIGLVGLDVWWRPGEEQLRAVGDGLIDEARAGDLAGARVAVQLHGGDDEELIPRLQKAGAEVIEVPVYRWTLPDDPEPALRLIDRCCAGLVDAVTFTAGPAVANLVRLADGAGRADDLVAALNGPVAVVCVGPVCAAVARRAGIEAPVVPAAARLGSMVRATADVLGTRRQALIADGHGFVLQGGVAIVDGEPVHLTDRERAVLRVLAQRPGVVVKRSTLVARVWGDPSTDPHALEAAITRLRAKLGQVGPAIETVVRRGYRLDATPDRTGDAAPV